MLTRGPRRRGATPEAPSPVSERACVAPARELPMFWLKTRAGPAYRHPTFRRDDLAGQTRALHEDGYALIPGVLTSEQVRWARAAIDRLTPIHWDCTGV